MVLLIQLEHSLTKNLEFGLAGKDMGGYDCQNPTTVAGKPVVIGGVQFLHLAPSNLLAAVGGGLEQTLGAELEATGFPEVLPLRLVELVLELGNEKAPYENGQGAVQFDQ